MANANANAAATQSQSESTMPRPRPPRHHPLEPILGQALIWLTVYIMWRFVLAPLMIMPTMPNMPITIPNLTIKIRELWPSKVDLFDSEGPCLPFYQSLAKATVLFPIACVSCIIFFQPLTDWMLHSVMSWSVTFLLWRLGHLFALHVADRLLEGLLERTALDFPLPCTSIGFPRPSTVWSLCAVVCNLSRLGRLLVRRRQEQPPSDIRDEDGFLGTAAVEEVEHEY